MQSPVALRSREGRHALLESLGEGSLLPWVGGNGVGEGKRQEVLFWGILPLHMKEWDFPRNAGR